MEIDIVIAIDTDINADINADMDVHIDVDVDIEINKDKSTYESSSTAPTSFASSLGGVFLLRQIGKPV